MSAGLSGSILISRALSYRGRPCSVRALIIASSEPINMTRTAEFWKLRSQTIWSTASMLGSFAAR